MSFFLLPVARLPAVDFPVITVSASLAGASPADMARSVATPLERTLGSIAGVNEMTSFSSTGSTRVTLQFDLERDIDSAAREVQAAINAARADLPATLRSNPTYRKRNPAAQPFLTLALTSATRTPGQIYDAMSNVVSQRLLQVPGVGDVELGGGSLPAVRVELNPFALHELGVSSEDVRAAIQANNANRPKGTVEVGGSTDGRALQVLTPAPGLRAADYQGLVVASRGGAQVRLSDVARVTDGVEDTRRRGMFNGQPAIIVNVTQQPGANLIETADAIDALLPSLRAQLPRDIALDVAIDRTGRDGSDACAVAHPPCPGLGEAHHPQRRSAEQQRSTVAAGHDLDARGEANRSRAARVAHRPAVRGTVHRVMPPSTGSTAPVIPPRAGSQSHRIAAATSVGSIRRPIG